MNLLQATYLAARLQVVRNNRFTTTLSLKTVLKNPFSYSFYCCHTFPWEYRFQYGRIEHEQKIFLTPQVNAASSFFSCVSVRGMAGHSKWQNIRHIKAAKDQQKSELSAKFSQRLRIAVKEGGNDPRFNSKLEKLITEAKKSDMSNAMIQNAIKQVDVKMVNSSILEIKLIGTCVLLVEIFTSKLQLTKNEIQAICKKHGAKVENGCCKDIFENKGIIHVTTMKEPNLEAALELAIEVGAEDVTIESNENGEPFLQFICGSKDLHKVKKALEAGDHNMTYSEYEYIPNLMYPLDENGFASFEKLTNRIYQHPDVVRIFDNVALLE